MSVSRASGRQLPQLGDPLDRPVSMEIVARIEKSRRIAILGHERPDGDSVGSTVALCAVLRNLGRDVAVVVPNPLPERFRFLNGGAHIRHVQAGEALGADLIFVLDTTDLKRLGAVKPEMLKGGTLINIDHHISNENFGAINWVDTEAAATGELIWRLAACCGWNVPALGLEALYVALVTDTGQFAYSNTTSRVLRMAAELIEAGVDPEATWRRIYLDKSRAELDLEARARSSLEVWADGRISVISLSQQDFAAAGAGPEATQEFPGIPRALAGALLALFFYELDGGKTTKVSIRSIREIDACALAKQFGGGGHRQAAGCAFPMPLAQAKNHFRPAAEKAVGEA